MNLNWSNRVIKYVLFVFNLLFVITGIIMIAVGVSVKSYYTDYDIFLNDSYFSLPNLLIAIGSLIFFISFFGCCGAIRESWFMIFIFAILLSIIFIMELSAGIAGYVLRDKTKDFLTERLAETMNEYKFNKHNVNVITEMWDTIQPTFKCCGAKGPDDWASVPKDPVTTVTLPSTKSSTLPAVTNETTISTTTPSPSPSSTPSPTPSPSPSSTASPSKPVRRKRATGDDNKFDLPTTCCKGVPGNTGQFNCNLHDNTTAIYYNEGCVDGFGDYLKDHAVTIGGVGLAIAFIQLFGVIFACHLARQLKHGFYST